jgi:tetratricopeptide (TPR) repeat protein
MGALDELLAKWRENPDSGTTLALCTYLGTSRREDLIREVGSTAEAWHKEDGQVMLAVGRMYLDAGLLPEAQAALVAAGKHSPNSPAPYRYLGEVLLRRGDATRAEKVFARALQIGGAEPDTRMWHDRAVVYVALQSRVGMRAVADEIERTIPKKTSIPPPTLLPEEAERLSAVSTKRSAGQAALPSVPPPPRLVTSVPPPLPPAPAVAARSVTVPKDSEARLPAFSETDIPTGVFDGHLLGRPTREDGASHNDNVHTDVMPAVSLPSSLRSAPPPAPAPKLEVPPGRDVLALVPAERPSLAGAFDDSALPSPETILDHLARVGVFERGGGAAPAWVAPPRERPRGTWVFVIAMVLAAGSGYGGFRYAKAVKDQRLATARQIEAEVGKLLETGKLADLEKTDGELSRVFDLDSRSKDAAILWLKNRVLSALLLTKEPQGIEAALSRCRTLEIDEARTAFGKIASFLSEGDLAGAAAILPKWDDKAKNDPFYHFAAAAMLERAGDVRAVGRYEQAFKLDPELLVARVFHAELVTLELGIETGRPLVEELVKTLGDQPIARALSSLAWAADPAAEGALPDSARVPGPDRERLPAQLLAIPYVADARTAARDGKTEEALAALGKALKVSATPAMATWIGQVAIDLGDEKLARDAVLRALSYSALYTRARALAARVALLGGRLDEAKKAIQELDAKSVEAAVVRAAAAYESLDLSELESATSAMGETSGPARALSAGAGIVMGRKYPDKKTLEELATPSVPWGDLVAVDAALDTGNLDLAAKIVGGWGDRATTPTYALRRARLLRYQGKADEAAKASEDAVVAGGVTPRVLVERFESLIAAKEVAAARDFLGQYPAVLGPMPPTSPTTRCPGRRPSPRASSPSPTARHSSSSTSPRKRSSASASAARSRSSPRCCGARRGIRT